MANVKQQGAVDIATLVAQQVQAALAAMQGGQAASVPVAKATASANVPARSDRPAENERGVRESDNSGALMIFVEGSSRAVVVPAKLRKAFERYVTSGALAEDLSGPVAQCHVETANEYEARTGKAARR